MVNIGWNNLDLANSAENDEDAIDVAEYDPVDKRSEESVSNSKSNQIGFLVEA